MRPRNIFGFSICVKDRGCGMTQAAISRSCEAQRAHEDARREKRRTIIDRLRRLITDPSRCVATTLSGERCRHRIADGLYCRQHLSAAS